MTWGEVMIARLVLFVARMIAAIEKPELVADLRAISNTITTSRPRDDS